MRSSGTFFADQPVTSANTQDSTTTWLAKLILGDNFLKNAGYAYECMPGYLRYVIGLVSGFYHPSVSHLTGGPVLGILDLNESGFNYDDVKALQRSAYQDPRGLTYFWLGTKKFVLVTRPMDVYQILLANKTRIDRGALTAGFKKILGPHNLFSLDVRNNNSIGVDENNAARQNTEWKEKRTHFINWLFAKSEVQELVPEMQAIADQYIQKIIAKNGHLASLDDFMISLTINMIAMTRMGSKQLSDTDAKEISHIFEQGFNTLTDPLSFMRSTFADSLNAPWVPKLAGVIEYVQARLNAPYSNASKSLREVIDRKFLEPNKEELATTKNMLQQYFLDHDAIQEAQFDAAIEDTYAIIFGGHETTSKIMDFTVLMLAKNPDIYQKLRAEVIAHQPADGKWTLESLEGLSYLRKVLKEVFRMYPPTPILVREMMDEVVLGDIKPCNTNQEYEDAFAARDQTADIHLNTGTMVMLSPYITQRDPKLYDNPDVFNPDRHEDGTIRLGSAYDNPQQSCNFFPFGLGERKCVGQNFALRELETTIAELALHMARIELPADYDNSDPNTVAARVLGTLKPINPPPVTFVEDVEACANNPRFK